MKQKHEEGAIQKRNKGTKRVTRAAKEGTEGGGRAAKEKTRGAAAAAAAAATTTTMTITTTTTETREAIENEDFNTADTAAKSIL